MAQGLKALVGRKMSKTVKFMGEDVVITKLSVSEVMGIQEQAKKAETESAENDIGGFDVLKQVIKSSVTDGADLTDEDFKGFAMDELSKLSAEIMKFSGIGAETGK